MRSARTSFSNGTRECRKTRRPDQAGSGRLSGMSDPSAVPAPGEPDAAGIHSREPVVVSGAGVAATAEEDEDDPELAESLAFADGHPSLGLGDSPHRFIN